MKKLFCILVFLTVGLKAQLSKMPADTEFFYTYGGTNKDEARDIKETPDKGYILVGTTGSFGQGAASVYMVKTDSLGNHQWSSVQGSNQNDHGYAVELTHDSGFFVAGYSNSFNSSGNYGAYYLKTDKNGQLIWQKSIDAGAWSFIYATCAMPDSGFVMCGQTYATVTNNSDAYLIRVNKNGDTLWTKHYGGLKDEVFNSVCLINNKLYAVGSNASHPADTASDGWIVKLDINGNQLQEAFLSYGYHQQEVLNGITSFLNSSFIVCGAQTHIDTNKAITGIVTKYDTTLSLVIDITHLSNLHVLANNPSLTILNKVINISYKSICVIGSKLAGLGGVGMFFLGFDSLGYTLPGFYPSIGGTKDDYGYSGLYASTKRIIGIGSTLSTEDYCTNINLGLEDLFLVRFNSDSINNSLITHSQTKCFSDTLFLSQAGIKKYKNAYNAKIYPNPANENTKLLISSENYEINTAKIFTVLGTEIMDFKINSNIEVNIDLTTLSSGTYLIKIWNEKFDLLSTIKFSIIN